MNDIEIDELKARDFYERRYRAILWAHPSCRDPEHPGCEKCEVEEEYDDDTQDYVDDQDDIQKYD